MAISFKPNLQLYCICFLVTAITFSNEIRAELFCTIKTQRTECSPLPVITQGKLKLTRSHFKLFANYESCFSKRTLEIKGHTLQTVNTKNAQEFELLGQQYEPVTDFISFPRTVAYLVLDTLTKNGSFTDIWSAQRLKSYPTPSVLTVPIKCKDNQRRQQ